LDDNIFCGPDMALALLGAILSLIALSKIHDRQIVKLLD
jgi:hypothetical protein